MRYLFVFAAVALASFAIVPNASAQLGRLRGGQLVLRTGTHTATLTAPPSLSSSYTLTLPPANVTGIQYLGNDGTGGLFWGEPVTSSNNQNAIYNTGSTQSFQADSMYIFNIGYNGGSGSEAGALINVVANGVSNTSLKGLFVSATNIFTGNKVTWTTANNGVPDEVAVNDTASITSTSTSDTAIGLQVSVTGGGNNYAAVTKGGSVVIGVTAGSTGTDSLEVNGNVLISGLNGLKITEGTNACMGTATLSGGTVTVSTNAVTTTSRILLTTQNNTGGHVGTPYVSAVTAGTSFTITSTNGSDAATVAWLILGP